MALTCSKEAFYWLLTFKSIVVCRVWTSDCSEVQDEREQLMSERHLRVYAIDLRVYMCHSGACVCVCV